MGALDLHADDSKFLSVAKEYDHKFQFILDYEIEGFGELDCTVFFFYEIDRGWDENYLDINTYFYIFERGVSVKELLDEVSRIELEQVIDEKVNDRIWEQK